MALSEARIQQWDLRLFQQQKALNIVAFPKAAHTTGFDTETFLERPTLLGHGRRHER